MIDYENVNSNGLTGCHKLKESDHIIIFFTKNAMKINMSEIADHGDAELEMIEVPAGKQSTDIHIGSYLGYLSGIHSEKDYNIAVISKDSDFDNVIKFWKSKSGVKISRVSSINDFNAKAAPVKSSKKSEEKNDVNAKSALNQKVTQILSNAKYDNGIIGFVASTVVKNMGAANSKQNIYSAIIAKYGQNAGLQVYKHIKTAL